MHESTTVYSYSVCNISCPCVKKKNGYLLFEKLLTLINGLNICLSSYMYSNSSLTQDTECSCYCPAFSNWCMKFASQTK